MLLFSSRLEDDMLLSVRIPHHEVEVALLNLRVESIDSLVGCDISEQKGVRANSDDGTVFLV
jgi:hypothetical protein